MSLDDEGRADYRDVFGKDPEPWREPLGALRLTLSDETEPPWTLERARAECEELVRVLNEAEVTDERIEAWDAIAQHPFFRECYATEDTLLNAMLEKLSVVTAQLQAAQATIEHVTGEYRQERADSLALLRQLRVAQATIAEALAVKPTAHWEIHRVLKRADTSALAEHDRQVKAEGWDEGGKFGFNRAKSNADVRMSNPYRASIEQEGADRGHDIH